MVIMRLDIEIWVKQALADVKTAENCFKAGDYYACAFFSQQSVEKIMKALFMLRFRKMPPKIHDLSKLSDLLKLPKYLGSIARDLTPESITTRYPDIAGGVPAELYDKNKAQRILASSMRLLKWLRERVK